MSSDEDDYLNMVIEEPTQKETFTQKKRREQREVPNSILHIYSNLQPMLTIRPI
jgi:hypothetical protein